LFFICNRGGVRSNEILDQHQKEYHKLINKQIKKHTAENNYGRRVLSFFNGKSSKNIISTNLPEIESSLPNNPSDTQITYDVMHDMLHQYSNGDNHQIALPGDEYIIQVDNVRNNEFNNQRNQIQTNFDNAKANLSNIPSILYVFGMGGLVTGAGIALAILTATMSFPVGIFVVGGTMIIAGLAFAGFGIKLLYDRHQANKTIEEQKSIVKDLTKDLPFKGKIDSINDEMSKIADKNSTKYKNEESDIEKLKFLQDTFYKAIGSNLALSHHARNKSDLLLNQGNLLEWKKKMVTMNAVIKYLGDKNLINTKAPIRIKDIENIILNGNQGQKIDFEDLKRYTTNETGNIENLKKITFDINNKIVSKVVNEKILPSEEYKNTYQTDNNAKYKALSNNQLQKNKSRENTNTKYH
jgi:hypothetical protein